MPKATRDTVREFTDILLTRRPDLGWEENTSLLRDITLALVDLLDRDAQDIKPEPQDVPPFTLSADEALPLSGGEAAVPEKR
jgi:hypothetical protein